MSQERLHRNSRGQETSIEMSTSVSPEVYRAVFDKLDRNGDGRLQLKELDALIRRVEKEVPESIGESMWRKLRIKADIDRDGVLNFDEFLLLMTSPDLPMPTRVWLARNFKTYVKNYTNAIIPQRYYAAEVVDGRGDYDKEYNCMPPPIMILSLSLIELAVFIYYCVQFGYVSVGGPVPIESPLIYNPYKRYQAWRYITYMLIHAGYMHILFNLLIQLLLGIPLELVHKWWRIGIIYLAGVIAGSLGTSVSDPYVYLAGASGGVYALITAHLANIILNWNEMRFAILQLIAFILIISADVGTAIYNRYASTEPDRVGYAAHLAGAIAGLLIGIGVLRDLERKSWETKLWWASVITFAVLMLIAIIWNAAFPSYFPPSKY